MNNRLPIRPLVKQGESLSGYIMRTAKILDIDSKHLLKHINNRHSFYYSDITNGTIIQYFKIAFNLDALPFRFYNKIGFCAMIDKAPDDIEKITFSNLFSKFNYSNKVSHQKYASVLNNIVISRIRRFCPLCLKNDGIYKLLWQVKEIEICDIHKVKLQDTCPKCKSKQSYYSENLGQYRCCKCNELLWKNQQYEECCNEEIVRQLKYYSDWRFLLDSKNVINQQINDMDKERSLAMVSLYVSQNQEKYFCEKNINIFHITTTKGIVAFINKKNSNKKNINKRITLKSLLKIVRDKDITLKEFSNINVPQGYINSITKLSDSADNMEECLSPWCKYFGKKIGMKKVSKSACSNTKFINRHVCMGCFMIYGHNRTSNDWETIDINFPINVIKVKQLILQDNSLKDIKLKLNLDYNLIYKIIGYLLNYNLLPEKFNQENIPKIIPNDILDKFKNLITIEGGMQRVAKKTYGWSHREYFFYFWLPKVRNLFLFNKEIRTISRKSVKKVKRREWKKDLLEIIDYLWRNDISICLESIRDGSSIPYEAIKENGLEQTVIIASKLQKYKRQLEYSVTVIKQFIEYINSSHCEELTLKKVSMELGINIYFLSKNRPGLKRWIMSEIKLYNLRSLNKLHEQYKKQIKFIILEQNKHGIRPSLKSISLKLGRGRNYIERYPALKLYTTKTLDEYI